MCKKTNKTIITIVSIALIIAITTLLIMPSYYAIKAKQAGATKTQIEKFIKYKNPEKWHLAIIEKPKRWHFTITHTPGKEYNIVKSKNDIDYDVPNLYLFYLFEYPDCEKAFDIIKTEYDKLPEEAKHNVYWIQTKTKIGKKMKNDYNVEYVPSSVISYDNQNKLDLLYDINTGETHKDLIKQVFKEYASYYDEE